MTPIHQGFDPSDVLPIKAVINVGRYAAGAEPYYIVLSGEIEMLDGKTGQRVYASIGARRSFQAATKGDEISWAELKDTFAWWHSDGASSWTKPEARRNPATREDFRSTLANELTTVPKTRCHSAAPREASGEGCIK